jgi:hypothetical protein
LPKLKITLKGRMLQIVDAIITNATSGLNLIVGFCILLRVYPLMLVLETTVGNNVSCARFYCALLTTCFGPDRGPSSSNMCIKYTKVTTVYVNGSVDPFYHHK